MVSFNTIIVCASTLASVCWARSGHAHMHRAGYLQARAGYNGTETTILMPIGTGVVSPVEYTSIVTQTNTKFVTVSYTLGNGAVKTTTITKTEETVQTIAHVKSTMTVAPIIETATPAPAPAFVPSFVSVASVASSAKSKSTSTSTMVVTVAGSETATVTVAAETAPAVNIAAVAAASSVSPACSVQTVYVPQYVTLYSTVTVAATPTAAAPAAVYTPITPLYSNNTITASSKSFESTSTTTLSVYTTVYVQPSAL